jgi:hypothetical protein
MWLVRGPVQRGGRRYGWACTSEAQSALAAGTIAVLADRPDKPGCTASKQSRQVGTASMQPTPQICVASAGWVGCQPTSRRMPPGRIKVAIHWVCEAAGVHGHIEEVRLLWVKRPVKVGGRVRACYHMVLWMAYMQQLLCCVSDITSVSASDRQCEGRQWHSSHTACVTGTEHAAHL